MTPLGRTSRYYDTELELFRVHRGPRERDGSPPPDSLHGMPRWVEFLRRTPCLVLLVVQLAGVVLYPFMEETYAGRAAFALFGLLVLALVVLTLRVTPFLTWVALLVAAPSAVLLVVSAVHRPQLFVWSAVFEMLLYLYAALSMLAYMLRDERVTTDELFDGGDLVVVEHVGQHAQRRRTGRSSISKTADHTNSEESPVNSPDEQQHGRRRRHQERDPGPGTG